MSTKTSAGAWYSIMTLYYNKKKQYVNSNVVLKKEYSDDYSQGTGITDAWAVVQGALDDGLPTDSKGIYFILGSTDVTESSSDGSFCNDYCGWHSASDNDLAYGFIGNAGYCPDGCGAYDSVSPNNDVATDGSIGTLAHELAEAVTDPLEDAWISSSGIEVGDICEDLDYVKVSYASNGAAYNIVGASSMKFLVPTIWNPKSLRCMLSK
eukprot:TRINITY_DN755_c0_g6_i1.p1 TRINITY_DN755_c0_g6~~TRINITY_DN755_c0_g6_i1.p1  ORF type:complete len:209 (+),score=14.23 TRINITY_DN755_c0_g6_i1:582-1208(+)